MVVAVSEVAEKVIFSSLVEEPQLFFRTFLEKLTHKDRQVTLALPDSSMTTSDGHCLIHRSLTHCDVH